MSHPAATMVSGGGYSCTCHVRVHVYVYVDGGAMKFFCTPGAGAEIPEFVESAMKSGALGFPEFPESGNCLAKFSHPRGAGGKMAKPKVANDSAGFAFCQACQAWQVGKLERKSFHA